MVQTATAASRWDWGIQVVTLFIYVAIPTGSVMYGTQEECFEASLDQY